jgi:YHS domain-containing protein
MIKLLLGLIGAIFLISFIRMVVGILMKGFSDLMRSEYPSSAQQPASGPPVPPGGELKRDPVCGTFISTGTTFKKTVAGETRYFCSAACRDQFQG